MILNQKIGVNARLQLPFLGLLKRCILMVKKASIECMADAPKTFQTLKKNFHFVILLGLVSLFADVTYEGARSIAGPYLALLGANAAIVGIVAGAGELIGYSVRYGAGYLADKTRRYWLYAFLGYFITACSVPLMAVAGHWLVASLFLFTERLGKAIRTPSRDVMLSYAGQQIGRGKAFGIHKALDQTGAMLGPLVITAVLYFTSSYRLGFVALLIPGLFSMAILLKARSIYPRPQEFEKDTPAPTPATDRHMTRRYWVYVVALCFVALGYADFPLIAYHFHVKKVMSDIWIPVFYAIAMGINGMASLVLGSLYDRLGVKVLITVAASSAFVAPLAFSFNFDWALAGMILWGIGMGAQDSIMKAYVAEIVPQEKRGTAYGMLNMCFGISWFIGSALLGILYDYSLPWMIVFSVLAQLVSLPFFFILLAKRG